MMLFSERTGLPATAAMSAAGVRRPAARTPPAIVGSRVGLKRHITIGFDPMSSSFLPPIRRRSGYLGLSNCYTHETRLIRGQTINKRGFLCTVCSPSLGPIPGHLFRIPRQLGLWASVSPSFLFYKVFSPVTFYF